MVYFDLEKKEQYAKNASNKRMNYYQVYLYNETPASSKRFSTEAEIWVISIKS